MVKSFTNFVIVCVLLSGATLSQTQWTRYSGNPVLDVGPPGSWDAAMVVAHALIRVQDTLKMWYMGSASGTNFRIGYAWSTDGINWNKHPNNPVVTPTQSWEVNSVFAANVIFDGSSYKMWYGGAFGNVGAISIGYAGSKDGITWTKYTGNPVLEPTPGTWDLVLVGRPYIMDSETSDTLKMWYHGHGGTGLQIGYATAINETIWIKHSGPVLNVGTPGSWDDLNIGHPTVYYDGKSYQMWFHGNRDQPFLNSTSQIGYATSENGINWNKANEINPILSPIPNTWESTAIFPGNVLFEYGEYHMWYTGDDGTTMRIGYATAPVDPVSVDEISEELPNKFSLEQNYPNPFNPTTKISWQSSIDSWQILKVYDVLGNEVAKLIDEYRPAGNYEVDFDASGLISGVYFYRLQADSFVETKKLILMK